jgi:hypothetical protein
VAAKKVKWRYGPVLLKRPNPNALEIEFVAVLQDTEKVQVDFVLTDAAGEAVGNVVEWTTDGAVGDRGLPVVMQLLAQRSLLPVKLVRRSSRRQKSTRSIMSA